MSTPEDFQDLIAGFNDVRARQRFETLKCCVDEAVPQVLDEFEDWPGLVKDTRNNLAHWLLEEDAPRPSVDDKLLVWLSLPWVLRTVLLYRGAKLDTDLMREGYTQQAEYEMYLANVRSILRS